MHCCTESLSYILVAIDERKVSTRVTSRPRFEQLILATPHLYITPHHQKTVLFYFFGVLECVGHSFAYVAHYVYLRDVWIRTQRAAVASRRATNLDTYLPT